MVKKCKFLAIVDGIGIWFDSYAIDRFDAIAQIKEIYSGEVDVRLFQYV